MTIETDFQEINDLLTTLNQKINLLIECEESDLYAVKDVKTRVKKKKH